MIGFSAEEELEIFKCMIVWELTSGGQINFFIYNGTHEIKTEPLFIIKSAENCTLNGVGYHPHEKNVIGLQQIDQYTINHEIGHVLGLEHEMNRPDRDMFIKINYARLNNNFIALSQFIPKEPTLYDYKNYPFDYGSVMMYYDSGNPPVIEVFGNAIPNGTPTVIDIMKVKDIYKLE